MQIKHYSKLWLSIFLVFCGLTVYGSQITPLKVGDKMPDMVLKNLIQYKQKTARTSDFTGKLLILDFWSTGCRSCIEAFPKMEQLQKKFAGNVQIITVTKQTAAQIEQYFSRLKRKDLRMTTLPSIVGDTLLSALFPHLFVPHHVWIDGKGIVVAITSGYNATEENIVGILQGKKINIGRKMDLDRNFFKATTLADYATKKIPQSRQYSSTLLNYANELSSQHGRVTVADSTAGTIRSSYLNMSLLSLFKEAYGEGTYRFSGLNENRILFEVGSRDDYYRPKEKSKMDQWETYNHYSYEQLLPISDSAYALQYMQEDLNRYFSRLKGIYATVEKRTVPCLVLIQTAKENKIGTKGAQEKSKLLEKEGRKIMTFSNYSLDRIMQKLRSYWYAPFLKEVPEPFINETGITSNVDIELPVEDMDLDLLKQELATNGLDIIRADRQIDMLVLKKKQ